MTIKDSSVSRWTNDESKLLTRDNTTYDLGVVVSWRVVNLGANHLIFKGGGGGLKKNSLQAKFS